jgi:hypothetical protein
LVSPHWCFSLKMVYFNSSFYIWWIIMQLEVFRFSQQPGFYIFIFLMITIKSRRLNILNLSFEIIYFKPPFMMYDRGKLWLISYSDNECSLVAQFLGEWWWCLLVLLAYVKLLLSSLIAWDLCSTFFLQSNFLSIFLCNMFNPYSSWVLIWFLLS